MDASYGPALLKAMAFVAAAAVVLVLIGIFIGWKIWG